MERETFEPCYWCDEPCPDEEIDASLVGGERVFFCCYECYIQFCDTVEGGQGWDLLYF